MPDAKPHLANFTVPNQLRVEALSFDGDSMTIHASTGRSAAGSPLCGRPSRRINGRYTCTLADLPWCGVLVRLRVRVGKFFCDEPSCERKIFAERLDEAARPFARGIYCRREALEWIGFALGGEAAATVPGSEEGRLPGSIDSDASDVGSNR
jgi:transposase